MHVVQISTDTHLLTSRESDVFFRQKKYATMLNENVSNSRLSILVVYKVGNFKRYDDDQLSIIPIKSRRLLSPFAIFFKLRQLHREVKIDLLVPQSPFEEGWAALLFGKLHAISVIGQLHFDLFSERITTDNNIILQWINRIRTIFALLTLKYYTAWRVVSDFLGDQIRKRGFSGEVCTIPVPIALLASDKKRHLCPPTKNVLYIGRFAPEKQLNDWLDIAELLHQKDETITFTMAGEGELLTDMQRRAEQRNLKINFTGYLGGLLEDLSKFYLSGRILLMTSAYEGFGRVFVEAAAYGVPSVTYDVSGARAVITSDINGVIVPQSNKMAAAQEVLKLLEDDNYWSRLSDAAFNDIPARYDPEKLSRAWLKMWVDCVA